MSYLNNSTITVDAVLTKKGREYLSKGVGLNITKFALGDDEIDYSLYNVNHPNGSEYFGAVIEKTPILEANVDESQALRYKLISIPSITTTLNSIYLPYLEAKYGGGGSIISDNGKVSIEVKGVDYNTQIVLGTKINRVNRDDFFTITENYHMIIHKSMTELLNTKLFTDTNSDIYGENIGNNIDSDLSKISRNGTNFNFSFNYDTSNVGSTYTIPVTITGNLTNASIDFVLSIETKKSN